MNSETLATLWTACMDALRIAQSRDPNTDDEGMRDANAQELIAWANDLRDRVGLCVDAFSGAIFDYIDARDSAVADSVLREAFPGCDCIVAHDPRGVAIAGAEREKTSGGDFAPVGLYMDDEGGWAVYSHGRQEYISADDGAGNLDRAEAIKWLRVEAFGEELRAMMGEENMAAAIAANKAEKDSSVCHAHDYCDANQAALNVVGGEDIDAAAQVYADARPMLRGEW